MQLLPTSNQTHFAVLLILALLAGCGHTRVEGPAEVASVSLREIEVSADPVNRQSLASQLEFTGNLLPKRASRLTFEVDGIVSHIPQVGAKFDVTLNGQRYQEQLGIIYGQTVQQGETLVELNKNDFELQIQIAEAKLAKAQADLAKLNAGQRPEEIQRLIALRNESRARLDQANRENARMQQLRSSNVVAIAESDQAATQVAAMRAMLESAEAVLASAQAGPTVEEVAVEQALVKQAEVELAQARQNLSKATLVAPYTGVIVSINVEVGDRVAASSNPVIEMMDIQYLVAEINVPEALVGRVLVGDMAQVKAAGTTTPVSGLVVAVNQMVEPQTRSFKVRVAIDNQLRTFKAGQFAKVVLSIGTGHSDALTIPNASIVFADGQPTVFAVDGDRVLRKRVELGLSANDRTEVRSGLDAGTLVVTDDPTLLADGMQVKLRNLPLASDETRAARRVSVSDPRSN